MLLVTYNGEGKIDFNLHDGKARVLRKGESFLTNGELDKNTSKYYLQFKSLGIEVKAAEDKPSEKTEDTPVSSPADSPVEPIVAEASVEVPSKDTSVGSPVEITKESLMKKKAAALRQQAIDLGIEVAEGLSKSEISELILKKVNA